MVFVAYVAMFLMFQLLHEDSGGGWKEGWNVAGVSDVADVSGVASNFLI